MTQEVWGMDEQFNYDQAQAGTGVLINGAMVPVEVGASFKDTIKNISLDAGFGKYRVFLNGAEIRPSEAPQTFNEGDKVELRAYDNAGTK
jgi:hypothetical protein